MIISALIISLMVYFIKATTWPNMIFAKPHDWLEANLPEKIYMPLIGCPVCMTPYWGSLIYMIGYVFNVSEFQDVRLQQILFTVFTASGISTIILMLNKEYDVAKKEDKLLKKELKEKNIK